MAASTLEVLITGDASKLTIALNQGAAATKQFEQTAGGAADAASSKLGGAFSSVGQTLKTLAPAFIAVGAAAVAGVTKGISATQQWASDSRTLQRITGQNAESASTLLAQANLLGIGVDQLSTGFGILSKSIVNGSTNFDRYGIATRDATGETLPFDDVLGNIIDKFQTLPAGAEQAAFAQNVFGRSGKSLIPILAKGREGMAQLADKARELGLVMGQDDLDASKNLTAAQRELGLALKGAAISLGKLFIPALTRVVQIGTKAVEFFTRLPEPVKEIGVGLGIAAGAVGVFTIALNGLKSTFGPVIGGITSFGKALLESGLFQDAGAALSTVSSAAQAVGSEIQAQSQNIQGASDTASAALADVGAASTLTANAVSVSAARTATAASAAAASTAGVAVASDAATAGLTGTAIAAQGAAVALDEEAVSAGAAWTATLGPIALVIAGVAAVAGAAVLLVKNWDKVKGALQDPFGGLFKNLGPDLSKAFGDVFKAVGPFLSSLGDAFAALRDAFGAVAQAARPLLPLLKPFGVLLGMIAAGPFLLFLKGLTVGLQGLAWLLKQAALGFEQIAHFVEAAAQLIGPVFNAAINLTIDGLNTLIAAYNKVGGIISAATGGLLPDHVDALDHVAAGSSDAAAATDAYGSSAAAAAGDVQALTAASQGFGFGEAFKRAAPLLAEMGTSVKAFASAAITAAQTTKDAIANAATEGADAWAEFKDKAIADAIAARSAFEDQARSALTFTTSMLSDLQTAATQAQDTLAGDTSALDNSQLAALRAQANITAKDILQTFKSAASQTKSFGRDLLELANIGGKAGKDLARALLESGNVLAAQVIADAPRKMQDQIVSAFGKSESAVDTFASKLTDAIVGPLKDILTILKRIGKKWGVDVSLDDHGAAKHTKGLHDALRSTADDKYNAVMGLDTKDAENKNNALQEHLKNTAQKWLARIGVDKSGADTALDSLRERLQVMAATKYEVQVAVHTQARSPWPEEALKQHLTDPLNRMGFKRIGDRYTLPLDVAAHTEIPGVNVPGSTTGDGVNFLNKLVQVEIDNRGILRDIRGALKHMDGIASGGGGGGTGSGGTGAGGGVTGSVSGSTTGTVGAAVQDALHRVSKLLDKSGMSQGEIEGVIKRVAQEGRDTGFIRHSIQQVASELGKDAAKLYGRALRKLDDATLHSDAKRAALIKAALEAQNVAKQTAPERDRFWWMDFAIGKNAPWAPPAGHTRIDPNLHNRTRDRREFYVSRERLDEASAYVDAYGGYD